MPPTSDVLVEVVHALLANARDLTADARLLQDHKRHARSYALAALAGEELGKVEVCLDWLLGAPLLSDKEFRRAWQNHLNKLGSLAAYRAAFLDDPSSTPIEDLKEQAAEIARRKMAALYVDFDDTGITTPATITAIEAKDLLERVETAVWHAGEILGGVTPEVVAATNRMAPELLLPLADYLEGLAPADAITELRQLLSRMPAISDADWEAALADNRISELLGLNGERGGEA